jgi:acyl-CoA dehydrogenase
VSTPNATVFKKQIDVFKQFLIASVSDPNATALQGKDIDFLLSLGEVLTLVAYGQLLIEYRELNPGDISDDLLEQIFDFMVRDFSKFALQLFSKPTSTPRQMELCQRMMMKTPGDPARFQRIWDEHVHPLHDAYEMTP